VLGLVSCNQLAFVQFCKSVEDSILYQRPGSPVRLNWRLGPFGGNTASLGTGLVLATANVADAVGYAIPGTKSCGKAPKMRILMGQIEQFLKLQNTR